MPFVSITRLRLRSPLFLPLFIRHAIPSSQQSATAPGNVLTQTRNQGLTTFWTFTIWQDEAAMRHYMVSGAHRKAMPTLSQMCDEASTVHWVQDNYELPSWEEIRRRMVANGRVYPLQYPSANHAKGVIQV